VIEMGGGKKKGKKERGKKNSPGKRGEKKEEKKELYHNHSIPSAAFPVRPIHHRAVNRPGQGEKKRKKKRGRSTRGRRRKRKEHQSPFLFPASTTQLRSPKSWRRGRRKGGEERKKDIWEKKKKKGDGFVLAAPISEALVSF